MTGEYQDPTAGAGADPAAGDAGQQPSAGTQQPGAQAQPSAAATTRSYTDADMAAARRSFEAQARREREAAIQALREEYEVRSAPKPTPEDPWSALDPQAAQALRAIFEREFNTRLTPFQQRTLEQTADLAFANEESALRGKYPDYEKNRTAILEFGVTNGISNLEMAYRAWKYDELASIDPKALMERGKAEYIKSKTQQVSTTPSVEGRGGGAPSGTQPLKDYDDMDRAAVELFRATEVS